MPRPRRSVEAPALTPGHSHYVLQRLVKDRRISAGEVQRYVSEMQREIQTLEQQLATLREHYGSGGSSGTGSSSAGTGAGAAPTGRRRGRPPGSGTARRGRPPASANAEASQGGEAGGRKQRRRRSAITPEQLASRQLQGRYLALIRQVPESRRAQYAKIAKEKGREAAIKELQDVVKK